MSTFIPTMSTKGWVNTIEGKADAALSYFITTDYSQSVVFEGQLASLPWLIQQNSNDMVELQSRTQQVLEQHLSQYYPESITEVEVRVSETDPSQPGKITIKLYCTIQYNSETYTLAKEVQYLNGSLERIRNLVNG